VAIAIRTGAAPGEQIRTVNLSASGVAYESPHWVEPFTKLEMIFVFPPLAKTAATERVVRVEAVVVRTEPEDPSEKHASYRVACCFTSIRPEDREFMNAYVADLNERSLTEA
jgi:hypothetical protein